MAKGPKVSEQLWRMTNRKSPTRDALERTAERVARNATAISRANGGTANYTVRPLIRPGGRASVDIVSDNAAEERGTEETMRINALRRSARGERA